MPGQAILIFGKSQCRLTAAAIAFCAKRNYRYAYLDLETSNYAEILSARMRCLGKTETDTPQIYIGQRHIGGHQDLLDAEAAGFIQPMLGGN